MTGRVGLELGSRILGFADFIVAAETAVAAAGVAHLRGGAMSRDGFTGFSGFAKEFQITKLLLGWSTNT